MTKESKLGGFDSVIDAFLPNNEGEKDNLVDPDIIEKEMEKLDDNEEDTTDEDSKDDKTPEPSTSKKEKKTDKVIEVDKIEDDDLEDNKSDEDNKLNPDDLEEADLVDAFSDLFAEELGWEFDGDEKPKSVKDLVNYMQNVIEENSQPDYASDEVKELDEFVKNGGRVKDYLSAKYSTEIDIDKVDLTKESNQKAVIRENLKNRGYSEPRIEKLISRYQDTDTLEDEAKDSYDEVKEFRDKSKTELLENQKKIKEENEKSQHEFVSNVEKIIKESTDIRGIELSSKEKHELFDYIFKPEKDGFTKYQKEYNSNLKNLVESAFFTMKGDKFVKQIEQKANTTAAKNLISKLKTKGKSTKNTASELDDNSGKVTQLWEIASKELKTF